MKQGQGLDALAEKFQRDMDASFKVYEAKRDALMRERDAKLKRIDRITGVVAVVLFSILVLAVGIYASRS